MRGGRGGDRGGARSAWTRVTVVVPRPQRLRPTAWTWPSWPRLLGPRSSAPRTWADVRHGLARHRPRASSPPGPASGTADVVVAELLGGPADPGRRGDQRGRPGVIVQQVAASPGGVGVRARSATRSAAAGTVRPVAVDAGDGCVEPSAGHRRPTAATRCTPAARGLRLRGRPTPTSPRWRPWSTSSWTAGGPRRAATGGVPPDARSSRSRPAAAAGRARRHRPRLGARTPGPVPGPAAPRRPGLRLLRQPEPDHRPAGARGPRAGRDLRLRRHAPVQPPHRPRPGPGRLRRAAPVAAAPRATR